MAFQWFDALATKFMQFRPLASGVIPTTGFYVDSSGNLNYASAGASIWSPTGARAPTLLTVNGAIPVRPSARYMITKGSIYAGTLAAPVAGTDDGVTIEISSATAFAHTLTATGLLQTGSANVNVATFAVFAGAGLVLRAYNAKWQVVSSTGITFS